jgi:hypothetical protein
MGAIVLAGFGAAPERGRGVEMIAATARATGGDFAKIFRWLFVAALVFLTMSLLALIVMEERPLAGPGPGSGKAKV